MKRREPWEKAMDERRDQWQTALKKGDYATALRRLSPRIIEDAKHVFSFPGTSFVQLRVRQRLKVAPATSDYSLRYDELNEHGLSFPLRAARFLCIACKRLHKGLQKEEFCESKK